MGARYSDRFFGPAGVAGQPHPPPAETIDLLAGVDVGAPGPDRALQVVGPPEDARPWHSYLTARLALVGVLLAGAGGGAYAWDKWRDHETEVVARSAVDVTSTASLDSLSPDVNTLAMTLDLQNDGPYPLTVTGIAPLDTRLTPVGDPWKPVELDRGEDVLRVLRFGIDCTEEADPDLSTRTASALVAELRTIDGRLHKEQLGLMGVGYYGGSLGQLLDDQCSFQDQQASYGNLYAEVGQVALDGDDAVTSTIVLNDPYSGSPAQSPVTVSAIAAGSAFRTVLVNGEPDQPGFVRSFDLRWTINDCAAALSATEAEMTVDLRGSMPSEAALSTVSVWPSPTLAAALARMSERVCG